MNIISVIPLAKGAHTEDLTYFTARDIAPGTIVSVPLRKKVVDALVVSVRELTDTKSEVKSSTFALKKVETIKGPMPFYPEFWRAAEDAKTFFLGTSGATLFGLVPTVFFEKYAELARPLARAEKSGGKIAQEKLVLQMAIADRLDFYKTFIRESFAKKQSVFLCVPTVRDAEYFFDALKKGIDERAFILHGDISDKKIIASYNAILAHESPVVIIATGSYLFVPRHDINTIIVERESSGAYKHIARPHIDTRTFAEFLSYRLGAKLIFADTFVRAETLYRAHSGELSEIGHLSYHLSRDVRRTIIDSRAQKNENKKEAWRMITKELEHEIRETLDRNERVFLFALRKGFATVTVCAHCDTTVTCDTCGKPLVLFAQKNGAHIYACNKCASRSSATRACGKCASWKLIPLGVGSESVAEEIAKLFPDGNVHLLDKEHAKTKRQAEKIVTDFYNTERSILVGTEMAIPYLAEKVALAAIVSFDSLFSIPSFRANEKIVALVSALENSASGKLLIQTKNADEQIVRDIASGNLAELYRRELAERKLFGYPPFVTLVKVTYQDKRIDAAEIKKVIDETFRPFEHESFQSPIYKFKNTYILHTILKLTRADWSGERMLKKDQSVAYVASQAALLPMTYDVVVEPEDIV